MRKLEKLHNKKAWELDKMTKLKYLNFFAFNVDIFTVGKNFIFT